MTLRDHKRSNSWPPIGQYA